MGAVQDQSPSLYDDVALRIRRNPAFNADVTQLIVEDVTADVLMGLRDQRGLDHLQVQRLAEASAILSCSGTDENRAIAYQIGFLLAKNYSVSYPGLNSVARLVFSRVGNFPAEDLLGSSERNVDLPLIPAAERVVKRLENTTRVGQFEFALTDFQAAVMEKLMESRSVSVSGPTSSGKSFLITQFLIKACLERQGQFSAAVVVPTRALIHQFQRDLEGQLRALECKDVEFITSAFAHPRGTSKRIYVVTQERLHSIVQSSPDFMVDLLIVDEAQNLDDSARGIILENTVADVLSKSATTQTVFLAPLARNPERLLRQFNIVGGDSVTTLLSPVTQNVFDLSFHNRHVSLTLLLEGKRVPIVESEPVDGASDLGNSAKMMAYLAAQFSGGQPSILYCNTPEHAEATAAALLGYCKPVHSNRIKMFVKFLSDYIHPDYYLIDLLQHGIGFHYGHMPDVVKTYVELLFKEKELLFLCCTSTLLEGVNLPAKNIFIYNPKTGRSDMDDPDFWNLAGRAGRLRTEFSGNVFCINPSDWQRSVEQRRRTYELKSALSRALAHEGLPAFITSNQFRGTQGDRRHLQQAVSYLLPRVMDSGRQEVALYLARRGVSADIDPKKTDAVLSSIEALANLMPVPSKILRDNSSIDPRRLERLMSRLSHLPMDELQGLLPIHPSHRGAYESLRNIFKLIEEIFEEPTETTTYQWDTYLAHKWMCEANLHQIIRTRVTWLLDQAGPRRDRREVINTGIRKVIQRLNNRVRFDWVRYLRSYTDVLGYVIRDTRLRADMETNLSGYLEIGAYRPGTLAMINAGVSRMTAILITNQFSAEQIVADPVQWIHNNREILRLLLPGPCYDDVKGL